MKFNYLTRHHDILRPAQTSHLQSQDIYLAVTLFFTIFVIFILPDFIPALFAKEGFAWSPINAAGWQIGDRFYYAAWAREVTEWPLSVMNPTSIELSDKPSIEIMKSASFILAAIPGFFISDFRIAFLISYGFFPAISVAISYLIARKLTNSRFNAALVAFTLPFLYEILISSGYTYAVLTKWIEFVIPDYISSFFRYINNSVSFFILILFIYQLIHIANEKKFNPFFAFLTCIVGVLVGFSYLPQAFTAYVFIAAYTIALFIFGKTQNAYRLFFIGFIIALILLSIGYVDIISIAKENTYFFTELFPEKHLNESLLSFQTIERYFNEILNNRIYKLRFFLFVLSGATALLLMRHSKSNFALMCSLFAVLFAILLITLIKGNPDYAGRLLKRAFAPIWYIVTFTLILDGIKYRLILPLDNLLANNKNFKYNKGQLFITHNWIKILSFSILLLLPVISFTKHGLWNTQNESKYIPSDLWSTYKWINTNLDDNTEILALNWRDIYLLSSYTNTNITYGHWILDNRSHEIELTRYLASNKFFDVPISRISETIESSISNFIMLVKNAKAYKGAPYITESEFNNAMFVHGLLYYPYVKKYKNFEIQSHEMKNQIHPKFKKFVLDLYQSLDKEYILSNSAASYVLLDNTYWSSADMHVNSGRLVLEYSNNARRLYKIIK